MGQPGVHSPALLFLAAFSRYGEALDWTRRRAEDRWGPVALESPRFAFDDTDYYTPTMGPALKKVFWVFGPNEKKHFFDPAGLVDVKLATNAWEDEYAALGLHEEPRPLNLDPGYLTLGKLVLASTKDFAHRIYLDRGIYAEITLYYRHQRWESHQWTFADYRRADYQEFFTRCRAYLKEIGTTDEHR
ncbi:MAG TPA: DUF4416 family protein [Thermoguttaceae bacterium]|nr:DUF4416 family protein [Thermoguttaceae bacterium]